MDFVRYLLATQEAEKAAICGASGVEGAQGRQEGLHGAQGRIGV